MSLYALQGGVAVVTLSHPPVNALCHALRQRLLQALSAAVCDPAVCAVVLIGSGRAFSAGADLHEMGTPAGLAPPTLPQLLRALDESPKPVVAALSGHALGGGFELALGCHARVALASASVGLPEITLGLIPGAGGTQRLPRLMGVERALAFMLGGTSRPAVTLADSGLFSRVVEDGLLPAACEVALQLAAAPAGPRAEAPPLQADGVRRAVDAHRAALTPRQRQQPAHDALLDAVMAVCGPLDQGLRRERELALSLLHSAPARALRHQFRAERRAAKAPAAQDAPPRAVQRVAVVGAGTMGSGIAICALEAGLLVDLIDQDAQALERGRQRVLQHHRDAVAKGRLSVAQAAAREARLSSGVEWPALAAADLVIEAVFEELAVKQAVFRQIDAHARDGAVLATNTSYLDIDAIAAATSRPQAVLGLHFFSPAQVMKLLEVVPGAHTAPDVLATGLALGRRLRKVPVVAGNAFGFIGNRIYNAYRKQCEFMLEEGAWPEDVDRALTGFGLAMGPFAVADLSGLDIAWRMRKAQAATRDPRERYVDILDHLCERGRLGRKSGAGYYTYGAAGAAPVSDAEVRAIIEAASARRGWVRQPLAADGIARRALLAMVNEAVLLLSQGVARRAGDVDVVLVQGYGFPRWIGGPPFWARQQPREALERDLDDLARRSGHGFVRADLQPLFDDTPSH